jgi:pyrimidine-nucleoside phosphorylase
MNFLSLIEAKRDGRELTEAQVQEFVQRFTAHELPDYQVAAFLMAICFRGLTSRETSALTLAMRDSGAVLRLPEDPRPVVDKHSTGGVGDKVSLPLAPLLACLGFRVPMISGRGLGITGGTLDKLESIPGFQTHVPVERMIEIVQETGCTICAQTNEMVPADKGLYALRDVTGTVPSQPLIVASILSKKLAEGLDALVLDVKYGAAAFMRDTEQARQLARAMVELGEACGVRTRALLTGMDTPLGCSAGNWLEIRESVDCLENRGPRDLQHLVIECAAHLLVMTGKAASLETARQTASSVLASGDAKSRWEAMLMAQGADLDAYREKLAAGPTASVLLEVQAPRSGHYAGCDARVVGEVVRDLGGGRLARDSRIDFTVGLDQIAPPAHYVRAGDILARIHARDLLSAERARERITQSFKFTETAPPPSSQIAEIIEIEG